MTAITRAGSVIFAAVAMLSLLLTAAALAVGRADGVAFYLGLTVVSSVMAGALMRRDVRRRRAAEAQLPEEQRPRRRVPRSPIRFPLVETLLTFAFWYVATIVIDRVATGTVNVFTLVAIAPFAAFMLTTITVAGRHMMFRLTAEEDDR